MCYNTPAQKNMKRRIPMKTAKRTLSILLALLMLASCLAIGPSADGSNVLTQPEWNSYWETVRNDNTLIALTPARTRLSSTSAGTPMTRLKAALSASAKAPT